MIIDALAGRDFVLGDFSRMAVLKDRVLTVGISARPSEK
jgi:hypothetical protein